MKEANKKVNPLKSTDKENSIHGKEFLRGQEQNIWKVQGMEVTISDLRKALEMKEAEYKKFSDNHTIELQGNQEKVTNLEKRLDGKKYHCIVKKDMEIDNITNTLNEIQNEAKIKSDQYAVLEDAVKKYKEDIDNQREEVKTLQGQLSK